MAAQLRDTALSGDDSLERFARPYQYTGTEEPRHILFDIASEAIDATAMPPLTPAPNADDLWLVNGGSFRGEIEEQYFEATVQFNSQTGRFEIESAQLDDVRIDVPDGRRRIFTNYLNESQEFRILLGTSVVYTQGRFFTTKLAPVAGRWFADQHRKDRCGLRRSCGHYVREGGSHRVVCHIGIRRDQRQGESVSRRRMDP